MSPRVHIPGLAEIRESEKIRNINPFVVDKLHIPGLERKK
jgi:hypothetical protein